MTITGCLVMLLAVFLAGGAAGAFVTLLVGIHTEEHRMSLTSTARTPATSATRRCLGVTVRTQTPDENPDRHSLTR
jgi:hypothetical protein